MEKSLLGILLTDTHLKESNIEIVKSVFRQATDFALEKKLSTIYHLGDIFDSRKAQSIPVLQAFREILDEMQDKGVNLIADCGNHDKVSYHDTESFIHPFINHPALVLYDKEGVEVLKDITIHHLPYFTNDIYIEKLSLLKEKLNPNGRNILFTHIGITGAVMNNGTVVEGISTTLFEGYDQIFSGHYHDKQIFKDKFNYIGSSIQHNFGEGPEKGLTLLFDDLSFETHELEFPRYHKIEVYAKGLTLHDIEEIRKENESNHDNLRIVLIGDESEIKSFNKQALIQTGVSVTVKQETVDRKEVDERIEPFTSSGLLEEFDHFCKKNELNHDQGKKYLHKVLKIA